MKQNVGIHVSIALFVAKRVTTVRLSLVSRKHRAAPLLARGLLAPPLISVAGVKDDGVGGALAVNLEAAISHSSRLKTYICTMIDHNVPQG